MVKGVSGVPRRPTGADVARLAGVNQASVSRVFAGKASGRVSPEVEQRIRQAAAQLRYDPHVSGQFLRSGRSSVLGLVVTDFENPFFGAVSRGAQSAAASHGHSLMLMEAAYEGDAFIPFRALDAGLVSGLLLYSISPPPDTGDRAPRVTLIESRLPGFRSAAFNVSASFRDLASALAVKARRVAYVDADLQRWAFQHRRSELFAALEESAPRTEVQVIEAPLRIDVAARTIAGALGSGPAPDVIVCADDVLTAGAYHALPAVGLRSEHDIDVFTFGGTVVGHALLPQPRGVRASGASLGSAAIELHLDQNPTTTEVDVPTQAVLDGPC